MNLRPSSTSSFKPDPEGTPPSASATLMAFPWPTPAAYITALTFVAFGFVLAYFGGWSEGVPPFRLHNKLLMTVYRANAENRPRRADIVLLGDSLMEGGVIESELAAALQLGTDDVRSLAFAGGNVWDIEFLVERLDEPRTSGPRIAVVQIDRTWFDLGDTPFSEYGRYRLRDIPHLSERAGPWPWLGDSVRAVFPQRRQVLDWSVHFRYGWLARWFPRFVRVPAPPAHSIWDLTPAAQERVMAAVARRRQRVVAAVSRQAEKPTEGSAFAEQSVHAFRLIVEELKRRSYHVVLLMPPFRQETLELIASQPANADRERRMRELVCDPARIGADAFVEFRDAHALGAADDNAIFIDYGHLNRAGAELQTRKLAEAILGLGLLEKPCRTSAAPR